MIERRAAHVFVFERGAMRAGRADLGKRVRVGLLPLDDEAGHIRIVIGPGERDCLRANSSLARKWVVGKRAGGAGGGRQKPEHAEVRAGDFISAARGANGVDLSVHDDRVREFDAAVRQVLAVERRDRGTGIRARESVGTEGQ